MHQNCRYFFVWVIQYVRNDVTRNPLISFLIVFEVICYCFIVGARDQTHPLVEIAAIMSTIETNSSYLFS